MRVPRGALLVIGLAILPLGCDDPAADPSPITTVQVGMACDGPDDTPVNDAVDVDRVEQCNYWRATRGFHLKLGGPDAGTHPNYNYINIDLAGLTGPGTYTTDGGGATEVSMAGASGFSADSSGDVPGDDSPAAPCTLVVDTNLHTVSIPSGSSTTGWISLDVSCPQLGVAQVGQMLCAISPTSFKVVITGCEAGL